MAANHYHPIPSGTLPVGVVFHGSVYEGELDWEKVRAFVEGIMSRLFPKDVQA
jgi:hypothetical protein